MTSQLFSCSRRFLSRWVNSSTREAVTEDRSFRKLPSNAVNSSEPVKSVLSFPPIFQVADLCAHGNPFMLQPKGCMML